MKLRLPFNKGIPPDRLEALLALARESSAADNSVRFPDWYLHRWHFLPEGYLSGRSIGLYDRFIRRLYHVGREAQAHARLVRLLLARRPRAVAELGCGPGHLLETLRNNLPEAQLEGFDLSPYMLEAARNRVGEGIHLTHADVCMEDGSESKFDALVAVHVLGHMPKDASEEAADRAWRLLKPGGWLLTVEHNWHKLPVGGRFRRAHVERVGAGASSLVVWQRRADPGTVPAPAR